MGVLQEVAIGPAPLDFIIDGCEFTVRVSQASPRLR
jgi:hypothetical protein